MRCGFLLLLLLLCAVCARPASRDDVSLGSSQQWGVERSGVLSPQQAEPASRGGLLSLQQDSSVGGTHEGGSREGGSREGGGGPVTLSKQLALCDCEAASGTADGLSCAQKEGYFLSDFERVGSWRGSSSGGSVPLNPARCCRPCQPDPAATPNDTAVAVVSLGCHAALGPGASALLCEASGNSLVAGWTEAVRVSASVEAFYPVGAAACCTPALLLASGNARELERCDCQLSDGVSCGGAHTHRLLLGFPSARGPVRSAGSMGYVPIGPALCCRACLSDTVHPVSACADLNYCSGRGACVLGACQCLHGYGGADCGQQESGNHGGGLPQWLLSVVIVCNFALFSVCIVFVNRVITLCRARHQAAEEPGGSEAGEAGVREPLLVGLDDVDGSVGSEDTTDCESDAEHPHVPEEELEGEAGAPVGAEEGVGGAAAAAEGRAGLAATDAPREEGERGEAGGAAAAQGAGPEAGSGSGSGLLQGWGERWRRRRQRHARNAAQEPPAAVGGGQLMVPPHPEIEEAAQDAAPARRRRRSAKAAPALVGSGGEEAAPAEKARVHSGVEGVQCSVCMVRLVQVALVPCGHTAMCRRCSRRLVRCPICRRDIARRQRLFVGG